MSTGQIEAGKAFVRLGVRDETAAALKRAQAKLRAFGQSVTRIGAAIGGLGAAGLAPLTAAVFKFTDAGDALDKMSLRTNVSVEALSELGFVAEQSGASLDQLGGALFRMQRRIANASTESGPAVRALRELGLSAGELTKVSPERQMEIIADRMGQIEDEALAAQFAFEIFGDGAKALLPMLKAGSEGIQELRDQARSLGRQMTTEDATAAAEFADAWNEVKSTLSGLTQQIGAALAPAATKAAKLFADVSKSVVNFVRENRGLVQTFAAVSIGLLGVGGALVGLGVSLGVAGFAIGGLITLFGTLTTVATLAWGAVTGPIGLAVLGIGGLAAALVTVLAKMGLFDDAWAEVKDSISGAYSTFKEVFSGILDALEGGDLELAARIAGQGIVLEFAKAMDKLAGLFTGPGMQTVAGALGGTFQSVVTALTQVKTAMAETAESAEKELASLRREAAELAEIARAEAEKKAAAGPGGSPDVPEFSGPTANDQVRDRIRAIRDEILTMKVGRDAAERYRLSMAGASDEQIRALEAAQRHRSAIEAEKKAMDELRQSRQQEVDEMRRRAEDIAESLKTPMERFREEVAELRKLQTAGFLDDRLAGAALAEARKRLEAAAGPTRDRLTDLSPTGIFSGFAAFRGSGGNTQERIAKAAEETRDAVRQGNAKLDRLGPQRFRR